jgi:hypothetical protein
MRTLAGTDTESYNDIGHDGAIPLPPKIIPYRPQTALPLPPHSVNIIRFEGLA